MNSNQFFFSLEKIVWATLKKPDFKPSILGLINFDNLILQKATYKKNVFF